MPPNVPFEDWKKNKIANGEWLSPEEFQRKKDLKRKEYLEQELRIVNQRLNPRNHCELKKEFLQYYQDNEHLKIESESESESSQNCGGGLVVISKKRKSERIEGQQKRIKTDKKPQIFVRREIILDTETTGLTNEDAIVEISMLELVDGIKTGRKFHRFLNPKVNITQKATEIHRITNETVKDQPTFEKIVEDVIKFIGDGTVIAHNAGFDRRMLNNELRRCGWETYPEKRFIDTLEISRYLFPNEKNSQDALCERFGIDNKHRVSSGIHSAVEDTAHLYLIYQNLIKILEEQRLNPYHFKLKHTTKIE
jgi:DNA polymerase-3 subunit epsilon